MEERIKALEERVGLLESSIEAVASVVNRILDDFYDPEIVGRIDKLVDYGKEKE